MTKVKNITDEFFTKQNITTLAWYLSQENVFKRNEIYVLINILTYKMSHDEDIAKLLKGFKETIKELKSVKDKEIEVKNCVKCKEVFPYLNEDKIFELKQGKQNFTEEFANISTTLEKTPGIYFLYDANKELIYIGKSYGVGCRVRSSINEREAFYCELMPVDNECEANILETYYISKERPPLNSDLITLDLPSFELNHKYIKTELLTIFKQ
jgi:hypothetical protein